jgi:hypothetical protein
MEGGKNLLNAEKFKYMWINSTAKAAGGIQSNA